MGFDGSLLQYAACALALVLAFGGGMGVGGSVPGWEIDQGNEGGWRDPLGWGSRRLNTNFFGGTGWVAGLCIIGAGLLWLFFWPKSTVDSSSDHIIEWLEPGFWAMIAAGIAGYVVAVLRDKGPVGPLE